MPKREEPHATGRDDLRAAPVQSRSVGQLAEPSPEMALQDLAKFNLEGSMRVRRYNAKVFLQTLDHKLSLFTSAGLNVDSITCFCDYTQARAKTKITLSDAQNLGALREKMKEIELRRLSGIDDHEVVVSLAPEQYEQARSYYEGKKRARSPGTP